MSVSVWDMTRAEIVSRRGEESARIWLLTRQEDSFAKKCVKSGGAWFGKGIFIRNLYPKLMDWGL